MQDSIAALRGGNMNQTIMNQTMTQMSNYPLSDEELAAWRQSPFYPELLRLLAKYMLLAKARRETDKRIA